MGLTSASVPSSSGAERSHLCNGHALVPAASSDSGSGSCSGSGSDSESVRGLSPVSPPPPPLPQRRWMNTQASLNQQYQPTQVEHLANIFTHGVCTMPSIIAAYELFRRSGNVSQFIAASVYGTALSLLFAISTTFHYVFFCKSDCNMRHVLHRCDRAMIYVFIAGSYFPWLTIGTPNDNLLKQMRWVIWVLAMLGIAYQQMFHERYKKLETIFYLITGIGPSIAIAMSENNRFAGIEEIKIGGFLYFIGIFFFKADGRIPFAHAIWHIFVAFGVLAHYIAILNHLYPVVDSPISNSIPSFMLGKDEF